MQKTQGSLKLAFSAISLFILANAFMVIGDGINDTIFNNYIATTYKILPMARGVLEFPRETPGFLIIFLIGFLYFSWGFKSKHHSNFVMFYIADWSWIFCTNLCPFGFVDSFLQHRHTP